MKRQLFMPEFQRRKKNTIGVLFLIFNMVFFSSAPFTANAAVGPQSTRVLIIFDVSKSMSASYEKDTQDGCSQKSWHIT